MRRNRCPLEFRGAAWLQRVRRWATHGTSALLRLHASLPLKPRPSSLAPLPYSKASTLPAGSQTATTDPRADRQLVHVTRISPRHWTGVRDSRRLTKSSEF